jgi:hypothetical protein
MAEYGASRMSDGQKPRMKAASSCVSAGSHVVQPASMHGLRERQRAFAHAGRSVVAVHVDHRVDQTQLGALVDGVLSRAPVRHSVSQTTSGRCAAHQATRASILVLTTVIGFMMTAVMRLRPRGSQATARGAALHVRAMNAPRAEAHRHAALQVPLLAAIGQEELDKAQVQPRALRPQRESLIDLSRCLCQRQRAHTPATRNICAHVPGQSARGRSSLITVRNVRSMPLRVCTAALRRARDQGGRWRFAQRACTRPAQGTH